MSRAPRVKGKYRPVDEAHQERLGLAHRYAVLLGTQGAYAFARAHVQGSYGKVHLGLLLNGPDGYHALAPPKLAIKAQRLRPKAGKARLTNGPKTFEASTGAVLHEFDTHQKLRRKVHALSRKLHEALLPQGERTLRAFVPKDLPSHIYELVFDYDHKTKAGQQQPKAYIVSTCELGDAHALYRHLWARQSGPDQRRLRQLVARSYAYQTFVELHVLHAACRTAHFDLKATNVHVNEAGGFRLADFGFALPIDASGIVDFHGPRGTMGSYEMYPPVYFERAGQTLPRLHAHTDIMANWVTALQFLVPPTVATPFLRRSQFDADGKEHVDEATCLAELQAFLRVLEEQICIVHGRPRLARLASGEGIWPASDNRVVDRFFRAVAAADVELFELALAYGMNYSPTGRACADAQAGHIGALLGAADPAASAELRAYVAAYADNPESEQRFAELTTYARLADEAPRLGPSVASPGSRPPSVGGLSQVKLRPGPAVVGAVVPKVRQDVPPASAAPVPA